ncbi:MAG: FprA family A-type flavoprotein [Clostridiales bacterium]|nr:FprA family A-type flavoprotein [Clostridiales bacterium]
MLQKVSSDIVHIGINDREIDLFEGMYEVPNGVAYNSYVILDEKVAVLDTVDSHFGSAWLADVEEALGGRTPDYLVVSHMEPDHSANIAVFAEKYKTAKIVGNVKTFAMIKAFFGTDFSDRQVVVAEGDELKLGRHTIKFVFAPMVHWPEVMVGYDAADKILFSADAFGKFGALDSAEPWDDEARRYYIGIVGKYGVQVQALLKKLGGIDVQTICPLHGPILSSDLGHYIGLYDKWSKYEPEFDGVMIAYTSVYGHTAKAVGELENELKKRGVKKVETFDLARRDLADCIAKAFAYPKIVFATTTYNNEYFPSMRAFVEGLVERFFQNKFVGIVENGSWSPAAAKHIRAQLETCKNITFADTTVTIRSALNADSREVLKKLADEMAR